MLVAAVVLASVLFVVVIRPAIERGGVAELVGVAALFAAILLAERWLRSR
jgi:hypothetical protein